MGTGYWGKDEETRETFQNILKSRTNPSHAEGAADDATWVRTGDLRRLTTTASSTSPAASRIW